MTRGGNKQSGGDNSQISLALSKAEAKQLSACETVIEKGLQTFFEVGSALLTIRQQKLYRESHGSFEEYCRQRWQMSRSYANRLIGASSVVRNLVPIGTIPTRENQVRPLTQLEPEQQREAWEAAIEESSRAVHSSIVIPVDT